MNRQSHSRCPLTGPRPPTLHAPDRCTHRPPHRRWSDSEADEYQSAIFSVGKNSVFKDDIKSFFKLIYEVVFGQENGPRLGSFIKIYTKDKTIELFNSKLNV